MPLSQGSLVSRPVCCGKCALVSCHVKNAPVIIKHGAESCCFDDGEKLGLFPGEQQLNELGRLLFTYAIDIVPRYQVTCVPEDITLRSKGQRNLLEQTT